MRVFRCVFCQKPIMCGMQSKIDIMGKESVCTLTGFTKLKLCSGELSLQIIYYNFSSLLCFGLTPSFRFFLNFLQLPLLISAQHLSSLFLSRTKTPFRKNESRELLNWEIEVGTNSLIGLMTHSLCWLFAQLFTPLTGKHIRGFFR